MDQRDVCTDVLVDFVRSTDLLSSNNQYPNSKKSVSSYAVIDQIVRYFDNKAL